MIFLDVIQKDVKIVYLYNHSYIISVTALVSTEIEIVVPYMP